MAGESGRRHVLILGGGINGAAVARELAIRGVHVTLVERYDLAAGATAYSSRLIHGGLRYLEYGEWDLVRESLEERERLRRFAPHLVFGLRLHIPVSSRFGGIVWQAARQLGLDRWLKPPSERQRGLWLVSAGLSIYDRFSSEAFPKHSVIRNKRLSAENAIRTRIRGIDPNRFPWICSYSDARITFPERLVIEFLKQGAEEASHKGVSFEVFTHAKVTRDRDLVRIESDPTYRNDMASNSPTNRFSTRELRPNLIVNATGAWVDDTLERLAQPRERLMGGTKGSHLLVQNSDLSESIGVDGVYAEARDGRPFFILPMVGGVLIGTTDLRFDGDPYEATADDSEVDYLLESTRRLFPDANVSAEQIVLRQSGVRPLPFVRDGSTGAITRRHLWNWRRDVEIPILSMIGGKLTTCRAFAEQTALEIAAELRLSKDFHRHYPLPDRSTESTKNSIAPVDVSVASLCPGWQSLSPDEGIADTMLSRSFVKHVVENEWAQTLEDLAERRLMLLYHERTTRRTLFDLASALVEVGRLKSEDLVSAVEAVETRWKRRFRRSVPSI